MALNAKSKNRQNSVFGNFDGLIPFENTWDSHICY